MRRIVFLSLVLILAILPAAAAAQGVAVIDNLEIALWPEFDRSAVLVIYRFELADDTSLPAQLRLPMPSASGPPSAVAWRGEDGQLFVASYDRTVDGDWATITVETDALQGQIEFYADYTQLDSSRNFVFSWPRGFPVGSIGFEIQEPLGATDLTIAPQPVTDGPGSDGLNYHRGSLGGVGVENEFAIELNYSKSDDSLTAGSFQNPPTFDRPETTEGSTPDLNQFLPWLVGGLGAVLLVSGAVFFLRQSRSSATSASTSRNRRRKSRREDDGDDEIGSVPVYCHICGAKASASDHFCRRCGTKLRT
jgi:hypothetical protein